ncbi:MAG: CDP-alcohol phosphatidyltransferase family protein, partial [Desulforhabdus sp.]|nr:CDP-alcohol phosphatidyltransferase family protein [Desulforhabdus sp.]
VDLIMPLLSDLVPPGSFHPVEDHAQLGRAIEQLAIEKETKILALKANVVIDRLSLMELLQAGGGNQTLHMELANDGESDGIYLASAAELQEIAATLWSAENSNPPILKDAAHFQIHNGLPRTVGLTAGDVEISEEKLLGALAAQTAKTDGFMARHFDRRISQFFSSRLVRTKVTPNQITLMGVSIGLIGALLLSLPGYWPHLLGSLLFVFCVVVDGVDGEVARLKLMESRFGHYLDITTDNVVHIAVFIGIAFGLYHDTGNRLYIWALWFLLGGFGVCAIAVYQCILSVDVEVLKRSPRLLRLMKMVSNRDFAYLVALLALDDRLNWFLLGAAIGTYVFAGSLWYLSSRKN